MADRIHSNALASVVVVAAQVGGIDPRPGGSELGDEGVVAGAFSALARVQRGKVRGGGVPRHVGVPGHIHGNAGAFVGGTAAQVGGVDEDRVNDEGECGIVVAKVETHSV